MASIDLNRLIQESISAITNTPEDTDLNESYFKSVVDQIVEHEGSLTIDDLTSSFSELFENEEMVAELKVQLTANNVIVEGFNEPETDESETTSTISPIAGLIASGLGVKKYFSVASK